jgi:hypothetical protein
MKTTAGIDFLATAVKDLEIISGEQQQAQLEEPLFAVAGGSSAASFLLGLVASFANAGDPKREVQAQKVASQRKDIVFAPSYDRFSKAHCTQEPRKAQYPIIKWRRLAKIFVFWQAPRFLFR